MKCLGGVFGDEGACWTLTGRKKKAGAMGGYLRTKEKKVSEYEDVEMIRIEYN